MAEEFKGKGIEPAHLVASRFLSQSELTPIYLSLHSSFPVHVALGPMMNPYRAVQAGRNWEGFGGE